MDEPRQPRRDSTTNLGMEVDVTSKGSATTVATVVKGGGLWYGLLFTCRAIADRLRDRFDERLAAIERKKGLVEPWTISARRFTASDLRRLYNDWDWSSR